MNNEKQESLEALLEAPATGVKAFLGGTPKYHI